MLSIFQDFNQLQLVENSWRSNIYENQFTRIHRKRRCNGNSESLLRELRALTCVPYPPTSPDPLFNFSYFCRFSCFFCEELMVSGFGVAHVKFRYTKRRLCRLTRNGTLMTLSRSWTPSILPSLINNLDVVFWVFPLSFLLRFYYAFFICVYLIFFSLETRHLVESRRNEHRVTD